MKTKVKLDRIEQEVEKIFAVDPLILRKRCRQQSYIDARTAFAVVARKYNYTYERIGEFLERDHGAIMQYLKVYKCLSPSIQRDKELLEKIGKIESNIEKEQKDESEMSVEDLLKRARQRMLDWNLAHLEKGQRACQITNIRTGQVQIFYSTKDLCQYCGISLKQGMGHYTKEGSLIKKTWRFKYL